MKQPKPNKSEEEYYNIIIDINKLWDTKKGHRKIDRLEKYLDDKGYDYHVEHD